MICSSRLLRAPAPVHLAVPCGVFPVIDSGPGAGPSGEFAGTGVVAVVGDGVVAHRVVAVRVQANGERAGPAAGWAAGCGAHVGGDQGGDGR